MSRILLDTSAYVAHLRGHAKLQETLQHAAEVAVSVVTLGELRAGFLKSRKPRQNQTLLQRFLGTPRVRVVGIDEDTSDRYAVIFDHLRRSGTPVPVNDLWIAASAFQHGFRLLTLDDHFRRIPHVRVDFFQPVGATTALRGRRDKA